ncbi:MAG: hypothetical protein ACO4CT_10085 [Planctomycetota bacterium]
MKTLGLGILLLGAGAGIYYFANQGPSEAPAPANPGDAVSAPEAAGQTVEPRAAEVPLKAAVEETPREDRFELPDGTWAPALNNAKNAPPVDWPPDIPYAPIVKRVTDPHGQDWYVHADGSKSTTVMTWREDLGRYDAVTNLANPINAAPREQDLGPIMPDPNKKN